MLARIIITKFFHEAATIAWIGGMIYQLFIFMPTIKKVDKNVQSQIMGNAIKRFLTLTIVCIALIIITGILATMSVIQAGAPVYYGTYGIILLIKHIITIVMIVSGLLVGFYFFPKIAKLTAKKEQDKIVKVMRYTNIISIVNPILGIIIILLSVMLPFFR